MTTDCETDCSALVRVCCAYAGILGLPADFRTVNEPTYLAKTGAFVELMGGKYTEQSLYLGRGDILVTKVSGHTVVVLSNGSKYEGTLEPKAYVLGECIIRYGCEGPDVKLMQEYLADLGYDLGKWGCDGDFGDCTDLALRAFQKNAHVDSDGECGPITLEALKKGCVCAGGREAFRHERGHCRRELLHPHVAVHGRQDPGRGAKRRHAALWWPYR